MNEVLETKQNVLVRIDEFEEQIEIINRLTKKYEDLKKELKEQMLEMAKANDLEQIKWTTPKGIKITLSVGHKPEFEEVEEEKFNLIAFMEEQPEMYAKYLEKKKVNKPIKNASNDRLVITLPKEEK